MPILRGLVAPLPILGVVAALLLLPAGVFGGAWVWPGGWLFLGVIAALTMAGSASLAVYRPASFQVRRQVVVAGREKRQPLIDALGLVAYLAFAVAWLAFIPLDVFRWRLLPAPPFGVCVVGGLATLAGIVISHVAIAQNRFAAPTIHDQSEDGQRVIDTGLYAVVRHPYYAGMLLVYGGMALWLAATRPRSARLGSSP